MSLKPVRAGVIGVGSLGQHHARILSTLPGVQLVGVCDTDATQGRDIAHRFQTRYFANSLDLIGLLDCVVIAVPTTYHHTVAMPFIEAGCHTLLEKPIAATEEEAEALVAAASRSGVVLQIGHLERFNPALVAVRHQIRKPLYIEAHRLGVFVPRCLDVDVVTDLLIHDIDMVLYLTGATVAHMDAIGSRVLTDRIDMANCRLRMTDGTVANLTTSRVSPERLRQTRIIQQDACFSLDLANQKVTIMRVGAADTIIGKTVVAEDVPVEKAEPIRLELDAFLNSIREGCPPACSGKEGLSALSVAIRMLREMQLPPGQHPEGAR